LGRPSNSGSSGPQTARPPPDVPVLHAPWRRRWKGDLVADDRLHPADGGCRCAVSSVRARVAAHNYSVYGTHMGCTGRTRVWSVQDVRLTLCCSALASGHMEPARIVALFPISTPPAALHPWPRVMADLCVWLMQQTALDLLIRPFGRRDEELIAEPLLPPMLHGVARTRTNWSWTGSRLPRAERAGLPRAGRAATCRTAGFVAAPRWVLRRQPRTGGRALSPR
jgi:hypothetical protein